MYKPSDIRLTAECLLTGTMERTEIEHAAACVVRACQFHGDTRQIIDWPMVQEALRDDRKTGREPFASILVNPFFRPDFHGLGERGYAVVDGDQMMLTPKACEAMRPWIRGPHRQPGESVEAWAARSFRLVREAEAP